MNRIRVRIGIGLLVLVILLMVTGVTWADDPGYTLDWWTVDGGGGTWSGSGEQYLLNGTIGQPDARVWSNGGYTLIGGFWGDATAQYRIYLPFTLRNSP